MHKRPVAEPRRKVGGIGFAAFHIPLAVRFRIPAFVMACSIGLADVSGHELPEDTVERAIQTTVYPDHIDIVYDFGLNPKTVVRLWQEAGYKPLEDELQQAEQFLAWQAPQIARDLAVFLEGHKLKPDRLSWEVTYQHHLQFRCLLTYRHESHRAVRLEVRDEGFAAWPGFFRVAVRGRPPELVRNTSAPPLIVRAERVPVQYLGPHDSTLPQLSATVVPAGQTASGDGLAVADATSPTGPRWKDREEASPPSGPPNVPPSAGHGPPSTFRQQASTDPALLAAGGIALLVVSGLTAWLVFKPNRR
ncbi:MAG: hypothetical protein KatS3mg110_2444 [Pirellulaceae bacterium]|nr:MAG: hypothetical protein KatS3mg110_2444 [Pirellulaceae bacterium]